MEKNDPHKRVGLVAYNHEVTIIGDGLIDQRKIAEDFLDSKEAIRNIAEKIPKFGPISKNKKLLSEKLHSYLIY